MLQNASECFKVLENGAFAGEVKPFVRLLVLHHFGDLQHEGPAAAHGLREALLAGCLKVW